MEEKTFSMQCIDTNKGHGILNEKQLELIDLVIDFNGISTHLGLFYAHIFRNRLHCNFLFTVFEYYFFFFFFFCI